MIYNNTFIQVAEDCPNKTGVIPIVKELKLYQFMLFNTNL